tara:strand:- start:10384 stop:11634 length:1251 start_codon:yes stop_codon:yes gene_type:complete
MEFYQSLFYATPIFSSLILIEIVWGKVSGKDVYHNIPDALASISSGIANIIVKTMGIYITIIGYAWFFNRVAIFTISPYSVWAWVTTFVALDFSGYWVHRWSHRSNFLWQTHLVHHSSEEYNLAVALRQSTSGLFNYAGFLLIPAAIMGVPPEMIAVGSFIHLYMQYWYHTQLINKMGFIDKLIVTPTHHRVHHAMNPEYIDRNFGQIFMVWDYLFGTYQAELDDVPPIYGITVPVHTWNPFKIDCMHWWSMLKDTWYADRWIDKFNIWIRSTGWRPDGHAEKYPLSKVNDTSQLKKYNAEISFPLMIWSLLEVSLVAYPVTMLFFWMLAQGMSVEEKVLFTAFSLFSIFTYTTSMEGKSTRLLNIFRLFFSVSIVLLSINNNFDFNLLNYSITPVLLGFYSIATIFSFIRSGKLS